MNNGFFSFFKRSNKVKVTGYALPAQVSRNGAYYDIGLTVDIYTTIPDEVVLCCANGGIYHAATHTTAWRWYLDGVICPTAPPHTTASSAGWSENFVSSFPMVIPNPGKHTIALWVYSDNTTLYYAGTRIDVVQFGDQ